MAWAYGVVVPHACPVAVATFYRANHTAADTAVSTAKCQVAGALAAHRGRFVAGVDSPVSLLDPTASTVHFTKGLQCAYT